MDVWEKWQWILEAVLISSSSCFLLPSSPFPPTYAHLAALIQHTGVVWRCAWAHPEFGQLLATCGADQMAHIWEEQEGGFDNHGSTPSGSGSGLHTRWVQKALKKSGNYTGVLKDYDEILSDYKNKTGWYDESKIFGFVRTLL